MYIIDIMIHSLDAIRNRINNPTLFDSSRTMRIIANIITHKIGSVIVIPINIDMEDDLKIKQVKLLLYFTTLIFPIFS